MISIDWAIAALLEKQATVTSVARTLGTLDKQISSGFEVIPSDPHLSDVLIGTKKGSKDAPPDYVSAYFDSKKPLGINAFAETCHQWEHVPDTPEASPFQYGCRAKRSTPEVIVSIIVTLSDDIASHQAKLERIVLQRGVL